MKLDQEFVVRIGGNEFAETPNLLACKGEPLATLGRDEESGDIAVSLDIYDEKGRKRAVVRDDELVKGDARVFEIRSTENSYTVFNRKQERVVCDIRRRAHARDRDLDVSLLMHTPDGFLVHANPDQTNLRTRASEEVIRGRDAALAMK